MLYSVDSNSLKGTIEKYGEEYLVFSLLRFKRRDIDLFLKRDPEYKSVTKSNY